MPTAQEVADKAGVTRGTVSKVFNPSDKYKIPVETQDRVRQIALEIGYRPDPVARTLATGRSRVIALWAAEAFSEHTARMLHLLSDAIRREGYESTIVTELPEGAKSRAGWPLDGIIDLENLATQGLGSTARQVPVVSLGAFHADLRDYVGVDLQAGAAAAFAHLRTQGHTEIIYVGTRLSVSDPDPRYRAYLEAMQGAGRSPELLLVDGQGRAEVRAAVARRLSAGDLPTALFCFNDDFAIAAARALHDRGLRIPQDVALVGCDGIESGEYAEPPLTTIQQPYEEMTTLAWRFLKNRLENPDGLPQRIVLEPRLEIRASSQFSRL